MKRFLNYLNSKKIVPEKEAHFYLIWVRKSLLIYCDCIRAEDLEIIRYQSCDNFPLRSNGMRNPHLDDVALIYSEEGFRGGRKRPVGLLKSAKS